MLLQVQCAPRDGRCSVLPALLGLAFALLALALPGCRAGSVADPPAPPSAADDEACAGVDDVWAGLGSPAELARRASAVHTGYFRYGAQIDLSLPHQGAEWMYWEHLELYATWPGEEPHGDPALAYAMYSFQLDGYSGKPELTIEGLTASPYGCRPYVGLANFERDCWEWLTPSATIGEWVFRLSSLEPYTAGSGLMIVAVAIAAAPDQPWAYREIDWVRLGADRWQATELAGADARSYTALAFDSQWQPWMFWYDYSDGEYSCGVARFDGECVSHEKIGEGRPGCAQLILVDDEPHLCYVIQTDEGFELWYARRLAGEWQRELVVATTPPRGASAIAPGWHDWESCPAPEFRVDSAGNPHIAYLGCDPPEVRYTANDGTGWRDELISGEGIDLRQYDVALALDGDDHPHLAYIAYGPGELRYARHSGPGWEAAKVLAADFSPWDEVSLVISDDGEPVIAYAQHMHLHVVEHRPGGWHDEDLGESCEYSLQLLESPGAPLQLFWADYVLLGSPALYYARLDDGEWRVEEIPRIAEHRNNAQEAQQNVALDAAGRPTALLNLGTEIIRSWQLLSRP